MVLSDPLDRPSLVPLTVLINKSLLQFNHVVNKQLNKSPPRSWFDSTDGMRVALCATNDWVFARVSATDGWLLAGRGEEMRSPPVTRPPGLHAGPLHIHNWSGS